MSRSQSHFTQPQDGKLVPRLVAAASRVRKALFAWPKPAPPDTTGSAERPDARRDRRLNQAAWELTIGRDAAAELRIDDQLVSRLHAAACGSTASHGRSKTAAAGTAHWSTRNASSGPSCSLAT